MGTLAYFPRSMCRENERLGTSDPGGSGRRSIGLHVRIPLHETASGGCQPGRQHLVGWGQAPDAGAPDRQGHGASSNMTQFKGWWGVQGVEPVAWHLLVSSTYAMEFVLWLV